MNQELKSLARSPGGWFFASNAVLYMQTDILVGVMYLSALVLQRYLAFRYRGRTVFGFLGLITGSQGILAVNAMITLCAATLSLFLSVPVLAASGFLFGAANLVQSVVYSSLLKTGSEKQRYFVLALCEIFIANGLALIAVNAGYSYPVAFGLIVPVIVAGMVRTFRPHWLPPSLAYIDLMLLTVITGHQAFLSYNPANAISRIFVIIGLSRLAVLRAEHEGKISIFAVERYFGK